MNLPTTSREEIISVCQKITQEKGLSAVNMRSVAKQCNVSVGAIYNYFPSKTELMCATVENIWKEIFHMHNQKFAFTDFVQCLTWLFDSIQKGKDKYPEFLSMHTVILAADNSDIAQKMTQKYFVHVKHGLYVVLKNDKKVRADAFAQNLDENLFIEYVFQLFMASVVKSEPDYKGILELVSRYLYNPL